MVENFPKECYKYSQVLEEVWNKWEVTKLKLSHGKDLVMIQEDELVPFRFLPEQKKELTPYQVENEDFDINFLQDENTKTFISYILYPDTQILRIVPEEKLEADSFYFRFSFFSQYFKVRYFIKENGKKLEVTKKNIEDFTIESLEIYFEPKDTSKIISEKIKIYELSFPKKSENILFESIGTEPIEIYSEYNCKKINHYKHFHFSRDFSSDIHTKNKTLTLKKNPLYKPNQEKDSDKDGISDSEDNCPTHKNPLQKDKNADGIGDVCSDADRDGIVGYKDNCPYHKNADQKDINNNGVGDVCEFDKDKDWIFDSQDNCITKKNPEQKDADTDGIGDSCDNCNIFNPNQRDRNNNWIWDACEQKEKYEEANDKDKDGILDFEDNCKQVANSKQTDSDNDGVGNACDNCKDTVNPDQKDTDKNGVWDICEDSDSDGIIWYLDNCPYHTNPEQTDSDNNGKGNACEDYDNDGILGDEDNCPYNYNPKQEDIDTDKIGDSCDKKDNRFLESNKNIFIWFVVILVVLFSWAIFFLMRKLQNKEQ